MNIIRHPLPSSKQQTLEEFADEYGLTLHIYERQPELGLPYYACFQDVEWLDGVVLVSLFGNGRTEAEAIDNYAMQLDGRLLAISAFGERKEVRFHRKGGSK